MLKPFDERNQTSTARRKLESLATASGIDVDLVTALANFTWDYDPTFRNEPLGWVSNEELNEAAKRQLHWIAERVSIAPDFQLTRTRGGRPD